MAVSIVGILKFLNAKGCAILADPCRVAVWDSSINNIVEFSAADSGTQVPLLVNAFPPDHIILATKAQQQFSLGAI